MTKRDLYSHAVYVYSEKFEEWIRVGYLRWTPDDVGSIDIHSHVVGAFDGHMRIFPMASAPPEPHRPPQDDERAFTHWALMLRKRGKGIPSKKRMPMLRYPGWRGRQKFGGWIAEGAAAIQPDGCGDVYLHSTVVGGAHHHIRLTKIQTGLLPVGGDIPHDAIEAAEDAHDDLEDDAA
jgi:hypothetical protein